MAGFGTLLVLIGIFLLFNSVNGNFPALVQGKATLKAQPTPSNVDTSKNNRTTLQDLQTFAYPGGNL